MRNSALVLAAFALAIVCAPAHAHKLRSTGETVDVAKSDMVVTPARDWNTLSGRPGKHAEVWTLDGEQLNDVTFFGGIEPGEPLVKDRDKKRDPLPTFKETTLLVEIPELLEGTYRTYKNIASFSVLSAEPTTFLGRDGMVFTYEFVDDDQLIRKGEAKATIIDRNLYMVTFDAPRLHYYQAVLADFRQLANSARLR